MLGRACLFQLVFKSDKNREDNALCMHRALVIKNLQSASLNLQYISNVSKERNAFSCAPKLSSLRRLRVRALLPLLDYTNIYCAGVTSARTHIFSHTQAPVRAHGMNRETQGAPFIAHYSRCSNIKSLAFLLASERRKESGPCKHDSNP